MMTGELHTLPGFTTGVCAEEAEITGVYCADLLSWAMGKAPEGCAWCTVMGNVNAVAVASLASVAAVVLCEGAGLDANAAERAKNEGINIVKTSLSSFEAGVAIAKAGGFL